MRTYLFLLFNIIYFSGISQSNDLLIIKGSKPYELLGYDNYIFPGRYKGELIEYTTNNLLDNSRGEVLFFIHKTNDTIRLSSNSNYKLKLNQSSIKEFNELDKKSWNKVEMGLNFGDYITYAQIYLSKGINNKKLFNPGIGSGILTIDRINFIPIYFSSSLDILTSNNILRKSSRYRFFTFNNIGYSFSSDFRGDYISTEGGLFWNLGLGVKKSLRKSHISLNMGYQIQNYKSEHNFWRWDDFIFDFNFIDNSANLIKRDGVFKRFFISFSIYF